MSEKEKKLTPSQMKQVADYAAKVAIEKYHAEREEYRKQAKDKRLHNTRLLMRHYRDFVAHSKMAVYSALQISETDMDFQSLLIMMGCEMGGDIGPNINVSSIQQSAATTKVIVEHIDEMLKYYEYRCKNSGRPEEERRYRTIYRTYIAEEQETPQEIADKERVDISTVYKDLRAAEKTLSALFFGYIDE